ncbi:helix-turn-helix domain-containing protein [Nonomuraea sp. bgisy101]|uniref:helix-turn-helix domain-containing protein n=1 Tax=Nonomuraea sp. bgisy101 TaxID=3413784 RepID=UPI003D70FB2B
MAHKSISHNGAAIRALRMAKGLTVTELARRAGTTPQSLSNLELEHRPGSAHMLNQIALGLGVGLDAICRDRIATEPITVPA